MRTPIVFYLIFLAPIITMAQKNILFFISQENTYYSEYIVMKKALEANGYTVDVRSASINPVSSYMIPSNTTIEETANTLSGSTFYQFQLDFFDMFGQNWDNSLNNINSSITTNGSILDVPSMDNYYALVIAGGTGILDYRYDGSYVAQGSLSALSIQLVAEKLNLLAVNALENGKPILAQCHGASLPVFWRVPNTSGIGVEVLGESLLKNQYACGYPEAATSTTLTEMNINYLSDSKVVLSNPNNSFITNNKANYKIITSRDWYPQTVAYAAKTLLSVIETHPSESQRSESKNILILHGGALNESNCSASNKSNDVPCNYGTGSNLPADYTHLKTLLETNSSGDSYQFIVSDLNLTGSLPYSNTINDIYTYIQNYDVVLFFKHWSTGVTENLQNALKQYVDDGGGLVAIHHGLYNDIDGSLNKNILTNDMFQAESAMNTWSGNATTYSIYASNYGHFICNFGINYSDAIAAPGAWTSNALLSGSNFSSSYYSGFSIYDELYNNMTFINSPIFGNGENEITPLFSHSISPNGMMHTAGFSKKYNSNADNKIGKLVYLQAGERRENYSTSTAYGQVIRNAVLWSSIDSIEATEIISSLKNENLNSLAFNVNIFPNPAKDFMTIETINGSIESIMLTDLQGKSVPVDIIETNQKYYKIQLKDLNKGIYIIKTLCNNQSIIQKIIIDNE